HSRRSTTATVLEGACEACLPLSSCMDGHRTVVNAAELLPPVSSTRSVPRALLLDDRRRARPLCAEPDQAGVACRCRPPPVFAKVGIPSPLPHWTGIRHVTAIEVVVKLRGGEARDRVDGLQKRAELCG